MRPKNLDCSIFPILLVACSLFISCSSETPEELEAQFTVENTTTYINELVYFRDQSVGAVTNWEWTFEGGNPSSSERKNPAVTFENAGRHKITLSVSNETTRNTNSMYIEVTCNEESPRLTFQSYTLEENVLYVVDSEEHKMNIYQPENDSRCSRSAIVLFVEGEIGAPQSMTSLESMAIEFALNGYVAAVASFRTGQTNTDIEKLRMFIRNQHDVRAAVRYMRSIAVDYKINTDRVFLGGHATGADMILNAAYMTAEEVPPEDKNTWTAFGGLEGSYLGHTEFESKVNGVFSSSGAIYESTPEPILIDEWEAPIFAIQGTLDEKVPLDCQIQENGDYRCGGRAMVERAQSENIQSQFYLIPEADHSTPRLRPESFINELLNFLESLD